MGRRGQVLRRLPHQARHPRNLRRPRHRYANRKGVSDALKSRASEPRGGASVGLGRQAAGIAGGVTRAVAGKLALCRQHHVGIALASRGSLPWRVLRTATDLLSDRKRLARLG